MTHEKRRRVARETARLLCTQAEVRYHRARLKAARQVCRGQVTPGDLPTSREVRDQIHVLARRLLREAPHQPPSEPVSTPAQTADPFRHYETLLLPLEHVKQTPESRCEGDALYHSLQVFALARGELPYDEEFLLAALLHDVGKAIDPREHVAAALEALAGSITPRTAWLIERHEEALALREGRLGTRARRRLEASEDFHNLRLLAQCDRGGHRRGVPAPDVHDALAYLRDLAGRNGE